MEEEYGLKLQMKNFKGNKGMLMIKWWSGRGFKTDEHEETLDRAELMILLREVWVFL